MKYGQIFDAQILVIPTLLMTNGSLGMEASVCCSRGMELDSERDVHYSNGHFASRTFSSRGMEAGF